VAVAGEDGAPELSYGTHFFQDLIEHGIYALPIHLDNPQGRLNWEFLANAPQLLETLLPGDAGLQDYLKVIDLANMDANRRLTILMDGSRDEAVGLLERVGEQPEAPGVGDLVD
jgi:hypothetical protein